MTNNFIEEHGVKMVNHPPYSPDLALCDFWIFDYLKRNLDSFEALHGTLHGIINIT